jgi:basic membrane protein A
MCLVLFFLLTCLSCSKDGDIVYVQDPDDAASTAPLVIVVYDPDALGDRSFNDLIYQGVEEAAKEYGLRSMQLSPASRQEGLAYLENLFTDLSLRQDTVRRLIIITTPSYDEFVRKNNRRLENNPYADLLCLETRTPFEGKGSTLYIPYYGAMYEAGAIAPHFSTEVLVVGANPQNESVKDALQGFCDGFATDIFPIVAGDKKVIDVEYLGSSADEGFSIADTTALKFLAEKKDNYFMPLLVPVCGGVGTTFHRMNEVLRAFVMMGVDVPTISTFCPFSAVKRMDRAVSLCIGQWLSADGMPKHQSLGLAENFTGVEIHTVESLNSMAFNGELTDDILKAAHDEAVRKEGEYEK